MPDSLTGNLDGRTKAARHIKAVHDALAAEALRAGPETVVRRELVRRATGLILALERVEARLLAGEDADPGEHVRLIGALHRTLRALNLTAPDADPDTDRPDPMEAIRAHFAARRAAEDEAPAP